jgi:enamine deaminase RidA (YjgF/YER057c/UK114 family)
MTDIKRLQSGPRMSQIVIVRGIVYLSGQIPDCAGASITEQTADVLQRIEAYLQSAGSSKEQLISANIWLTDTAHFAEFNAVWDAWLAPGQAPTRACVQALLMKPGCDVEIAVTALVAAS